MAARELKVEQPRTSVVADEHVLLLVQIVVAHAARMNRFDQRIELVEEVLGQRARLAERLAYHEATHEHAFHLVVIDEPRDALEPCELFERSLLARQQAPRDEAREGHP